MVIRSLSHSSPVGCLLGVLFQHRGEKTPFSNQRVEEVDFLDIDLDGGITNDGPANGLLPHTMPEHGDSEALNHTAVAGDMGNPFGRPPGLPPTPPNRLVTGDSKQN